VTGPLRVTTENFKSISAPVDFFCGAECLGRILARRRRSMPPNYATTNRLASHIRLLDLRFGSHLNRNHASFVRLCEHDKMRMREN
jgi:hypothetical protein